MRNETAYLSSEDFQNQFRWDCGMFLNMGRRVIGTMDENCHIKESDEKDPLIRCKREDGSLQNIHAMAPVGALFCTRWRDGMLDEWRETQNGAKWPANDILQGVAPLGFHIVPYQMKPSQNENESDIKMDNDSAEAEKQSESSRWIWKLDFRAAEQYLFKHLTTKQRQIVYCAQSLLSSFREINRVQELNELIRHSIFEIFAGNFRG